MRTLIISPERVRRTINRMAYEVVERSRGAEDLVILGILEKGFRVAETLAEDIERVIGQPLSVVPVNVKSLRVQNGDDTPVLDASGKRVLLVDDVLRSGRTAARAAAGVSLHCGRPARIELAVLIDRGHREVPVQPNYVGRTIQTKAKEHVSVDVEKGFAVYLEE